MFKNIQSIHYTEKEFSEDTYFFNEGFAFVIDGASPLIKNNNSNFITYKFVNDIKKNLIIYLKKNISIDDALKKSLRETLLNDFSKDFVNNDVSAAISILRIRDDYLEIFYLGDCNILIEYDYDYELFTCRKLEYFDNLAKKKMIDISNIENISILETREHDEIKKQLSKNRSLKNKDNGYYILDTSGNGVNNAYYEKIKLNSIRSILVSSDGFSQAYDTLNIYNDYNSFINDIRIGSLKSIQEDIVRVQNSDKLLNNYPRFSKTDDITAIYMEL